MRKKIDNKNIESIYFSYFQLLFSFHIRDTIFSYPLAVEKRRYVSHVSTWATQNVILFVGMYVKRGRRGGKRGTSERQCIKHRKKTDNVVSDSDDTISSFFATSVKIRIFNTRIDISSIVEKSSRRYLFFSRPNQISFSFLFSSLSPRRGSLSFGCEIYFTCVRLKQTSNLNGNFVGTAQNRISLIVVVTSL